MHKLLLTSSLSLIAMFSTFHWLWSLTKSTPPPRIIESEAPHDYPHDSIRLLDYAQAADGFWLFEPISPMPDTAPVLVFLHGYGAINPMIYGGWIRHLVQQGNVVIYPRYQWDIMSPSAKKFVPNATKAIQNALDILENEGHPHPTNDFGYIGHSFGGSISAHLSARADSLGLPIPNTVLLAAPGTGPLKATLLDDYAGIPADTRLLTVIHERDYVVGDALGIKVHTTATETPNRLLLYTRMAQVGQQYITAGHNEIYALDEAFDTGIRNFTAKRALRIARTDTLDVDGFWRWQEMLEDPSVSMQDTSLWSTLPRWPGPSPVIAIGQEMPVAVEAKD
ncbi:MAG: hypothetical protein AAF840_15125 [Bacteroidota bacterium]